MARHREESRTASCMQLLDSRETELRCPICMHPLPSRDIADYRPNYGMITVLQLLDQRKQDDRLQAIQLERVHTVSERSHQHTPSKPLPVPCAAHHIYPQSTGSSDTHASSERRVHDPFRAAHGRASSLPTEHSLHPFSQQRNGSMHATYPSAPPVHDPYPSASPMHAAPHMHDPISSAPPMHAAFVVLAIRALVDCNSSTHACCKSFYSSVGYTS
jgi:hypothetical protein